MKLLQFAVLVSFLAVFSINGYSRPSESGGPTIRLPDDESSHTDPLEWWYYTGILETNGGERYGFEMVVFQMIPSEAPVYFTHFAITDQKKGKFHLATKVSHTNRQDAESGFDHKLDTWHMSGHAGVDKLVADMPGYSVDLVLRAKKPVVLQYGNGQMTIGSDNPFYYYSYTRMAVTGTLTDDGKKKSVTGWAWMDHQWGDIGNDFEGWDWFSIRFDDLSEVMLFVVRRSGKSGFAGGTAIFKDGTYKPLRQDDFKIKPTGQWKSPHTGAVYPHGWTIEIASLEKTVSVVPVIADQEFYHTVAGSPVYWEGLCEVRGKEKNRVISGHAYVELLGYTP